MDYKRIHDSIVTKAKRMHEERKLAKKKGYYFEKHHILPRCLGGDNSNENLVYLTPEEHYLIHQLLVKIRPDDRNLIYAVHRMSQTNSTCNKGNNKSYGWVRRRHAKEASEFHKGKNLSKYQRQRIVESNSTRVVSAETKQKISNSLKGKECSEDLRRRRSVNQLGRKYSKEFGAAISTRQQGKCMSPAVSCIYCKKEGRLSGMIRWHLDHCKNKGQ